MIAGSKTSLNTVIAMAIFINKKKRKGYLKGFSHHSAHSWRHSPHPSWRHPRFRIPSHNHIVNSQDHFRYFCCRTQGLGLCLLYPRYPPFFPLLLPPTPRRCFLIFRASFPPSSEAPTPPRKKLFPPRNKRKAPRP